MPVLINAYSGNDSVANSLKSLGQSMFGDQARQEVYRQTAKKGARENDAAERLAEYYRSGDYRNAGAEALRANPGATNMGAIGLAGTALDAGKNYRDPRLATMALGAGHSAEGTFPGLDATLAQRATAAHEATERQAATQQAIDARTLVPVMGPDGRLHYERKSEAAGHAAPMSTDQVTAGLIQDQMHPPAAAAPIVTDVGAPPPAAPAAPSGYIHPLVQKALGYPTGAVPYQHLETGALGQSYDGGKTVDGHPAGPGWVAVSPENAITQTRTNAQIDAAGKPLPAAPTAYPQTALDAAKTSGSKALFQGAVNETWGLLGVGEAGADTNRARENLTNLANEARAVVLSSPGRAAVQAQKWANASIPQPGALGITGVNADEEKNKVISFTTHLRGLYADEAAEAQDRTTAPDQRQKLLVHMAQLKRIIGAYEAPPTQAAPPAAPAPGAPPSATPSILRYDAQGNRVQ